jgi:hypothetical protein
VSTELKEPVLYDEEPLVSFAAVKFSLLIDTYRGAGVRRIEELASKMIFRF